MPATVAAHKLTNQVIKEMQELFHSNYSQSCVQAGAESHFACAQHLDLSYDLICQLAQFHEILRLIFWACGFNREGPTILVAPGPPPGMLTAPAQVFQEGEKYSPGGFWGNKNWQSPTPRWRNSILLPSETRRESLFVFPSANCRFLHSSPAQWHVM